VLDSSDDSTIAKNVFDGILVNAGATATLIARNSADRSGHDGIETDAPGTTLSRNSANRNHDLGMEAVPGVIDGGGNHAFGNGNPAQCTEHRVLTPRTQSIGRPGRLMAGPDGSCRRPPQRRAPESASVKRTASQLAALGPDGLVPDGAGPLR